jgi:hypothetical protein
LFENGSRSDTLTPPSLEVDRCPSDKDRPPG